MNVVSDALNLIMKPGPQGQSPQDPCEATCLVRVMFNNEPKDYYFDRPNGCISKGVNDNDVNTYFNDCCDKHNYCLNAKCCTTNCQELKNKCDQEYYTCTRAACMPLYMDEVKFYPCQAKAAYMVSGARNRTCNPMASNNRKICFC